MKPSPTEAASVCPGWHHRTSPPAFEVVPFQTAAYLSNPCVGDGFGEWWRHDGTLYRRPPRGRASWRGILLAIADHPSREKRAPGAFLVEPPPPAGA
ncbi:MAG: hypothetical protein OEX04_00385 [Acidimicrobiia bacterium]|nr:hypothetical protein [Acidimicrobiia bacterium]